MKPFLRSSAHQNISLWEHAHYHVHKGPLLDLSCVTRIQSIRLLSHIYHILQSKPWSPKWSLTFKVHDNMYAFLINTRTILRRYGTKPNSTESFRLVVSKTKVCSDVLISCSFYLLSTRAAGNNVPHCGHYVCGYARQYYFGVIVCILAS
jgi:hypothetical protein